MRQNPYDDVLVASSAVSLVAIQSLTGSSAVNGDSIDTAVTFDADSIMVRIRTEIASGTPTTATVAWALQESSDNSTFTAALDNTGTAIGSTITTKTVAADVYARVEGIMVNRKRYLRIVLTPAYTGGSSPATLTFAEYIGTSGNSQVNAGRATSNT
jgi:hypothetical protein